MYLVKIEDGEAITDPVPEQNARDCEPHFHGQMITPQLAEMYGYGVYEFGVEPPTGKYKRVERDVITRREDAIWVQQYVLRDATDDKQAKEAARKLGYKKSVEGTDGFIIGDTIIIKPY